MPKMITHPIPDLTGYITEGQIIRPAMIIGYRPSTFPSLSFKFSDKGSGEGKTWEDQATMNCSFCGLRLGGKQAKGAGESLPYRQVGVKFTDRAKNTSPGVSLND